MIDRRDFIRHAGVGALAAAALGRRAAADNAVKLPSLDAPSEERKPAPRAWQPPGERVGFAVVGLGHLTLEQLLPAFVESRRGKLVALVSGDPAKAAKLAAQHGVDRAAIYDYKTFDRIADNPAIDCVYIVLPNSMHLEFTERAARAGKHVLCEKPMATTSADAQRMIEACKAAHKKLMIAYRIQYEPMNRFAMRAVRDARFGKIKLIEGHNGQNLGDPNQWRCSKAMAGSGSLFDVGIYCLNTARFALGEEPSWVQAATFSTPNDPRFKQVEENIVFQVGWPSGALGHFSASYGTHASRRYRAYGDKGGWIGLDPAFDYAGLSLELAEVRDGKDVRERPSIAASQQFAAEIDHMASCIRDDHTPYTPGEEGLADLKIMEAILTAARDGRRVELPQVTTLDSYRGHPPDAA